MYKIASFEITDIPLIELISKSKKPIIISNGLANYKDLKLNYFPFPGYSNLNNGITTDASKNDGTADTKFIKTDVLVADDASNISSPIEEKVCSTIQWCACVLLC